MLIGVRLFLDRGMVDVKWYMGLVYRIYQPRSGLSCHLSTVHSKLRLAPKKCSFAFLCFVLPCEMLLAVKLTLDFLCIAK